MPGRRYGAAVRACRCGSGQAYDACCGALHRGRLSGRATAATAEQLMRSRYTAFAVGDDVYLLATWHPSTRPTSLVLDDRIEWRRLEILGATGGGEDDDTGTVEFIARYWDTEHLVPGEQHEDSAFVCEDGQWFYVAPVPGDDRQR